MLTLCFAIITQANAETSNKKVVDHLQQTAENRKEAAVSVDYFDISKSITGFFKPQVKTATSKTLLILAAFFGLSVILFIIWVIRINFKDDKYKGGLLLFIFFLIDWFRS